MTEKTKPTSRSEYPHLAQVATRWADNDAYGHMNNVVYYSYFDTAVNRHLIENEVLNLQTSTVIGLVVETRCTYFSSIAFPDMVTIGLKVMHLGTSSVRYQIALFRNKEVESAATGEFVHVYVDRSSNKPTAMPANVRALLQTLQN